MGFYHFLTDLAAASFIPGFVLLVIIVGNWFEPKKYLREYHWKTVVVLWFLYSSFIAYEHFAGHPVSHEVCEELGRFNQYVVCDDVSVP